MTSEVTFLDDRRPGVYYEIAILHRWDGSLSVWIKDVADDEESRRRIAADLRAAAGMMEKP